MIFKKQSFSPNLSKFFSRQGEAIDARHKRCAAWWRLHLTNCRDYIERHVPKSKSVAVLGAGRLLDIDPDLLLSRCETVHLFDADQTAVRYWKSRFGSTHRDRLVFRNLDLTGCLDNWIRSLPRAAPTNYLNSLEAPVLEWSKEPFDGYISLNLLGQIPLYWRDQVLDQYSDISPEESQALVNSMGQLQEAHLRALISGKDRWSILLTDTEYYFYHCDRSEWRVEPALFGKAADLYAREFAKLPAGEAWLWHIAPQFIEDDAEGEIHRVEARFRR